MAISCPAWSISGYLEVREGHLNISGADALDLVEQYDSPLFVFSEARIRDNIARLQHAASAVDRPIKFCYASKANSNMAILKTVLDSGIDVEVNSGGELFKALRVGFQPDQIIFNADALRDLTAKRYLRGRLAHSLADIDAPRHAAHLGLRLDSGPVFRLGEMQVSGTRRSS